MSKNTGLTSPFRKFFKGASALLLGSIATSVPAANLSDQDNAAWNVPNQRQELDPCLPEILALADLGVIPGTYEGCISDRGLSLQELLDKLPVQPQLPGVPRIGPVDDFYRAIMHQGEFHYNNGWGNGDQDAPTDPADGHGENDPDATDPTPGNNPNIS